MHNRAFCDCLDRDNSRGRAFRGKLRRNKTMIKILFICHGIPVS
nr:MAG TPA: PUTATIVE ACID PHOSPHATASE WZB, PHOSPHATASE [Caudoviricetes sp.]